MNQTSKNATIQSDLYFQISKLVQLRADARIIINSLKSQMAKSLVRMQSVVEHDQSFATFIAEQSGAITLHANDIDSQLRLIQTLDSEIRAIELIIARDAARA